MSVKNAVVGGLVGVTAHQLTRDVIHFLWPSASVLGVVVEESLAIASGAILGGGVYVALQSQDEEAEEGQKALQDLLTQQQEVLLDVDRRTQQILEAIEAAKKGA